METIPNLTMGFDSTSTEPGTLIPLQPEPEPEPESESDHQSLGAAGGGGGGGGPNGQDDLPQIGMEFDSPESARAFYCAYASRAGFRVRNSKSFTSRVDDSVIMRRFVCSRQGRPSKKDPFDLTKKRRNRASSREGCRAMLQVNRRENGRWCASRFVQEHCHPLGLVSDPSPPSLNKKQKKNPSELSAFPDNSGNNNNNNNTTDMPGPHQSGLGPGGGVAQSLLEYFKKMQSDNPAFRYAVRLDRNNCVANLFWADARAQLAYSRFGDAVVFDMSCKRNRRVVPFAAFTGFNHHRQVIVFGCAFMTDESEESFTWLFDTWCSMIGRHKPVSFTTFYNEAVESAVSKVFSDVPNRFCKRDIFNRCKERLSDLYSENPGFKPDLKRCVNGSDSPDEFESGWKTLIERYDLTQNDWLQFIYEIRHKWVSAYLKDAFFGDFKLENMQKFFQRNSITTTTLRDLVTQFDKAIALQYETEIQLDLPAIQTRPVMRTPSPMEKQASEIYTKSVFDLFQEELIKSSDYFAEKFEEEGPICKFRVIKLDSINKVHVVSYNDTEKSIFCTCRNFEFTGIQCCHALRVLIFAGSLSLPERYLLKRWGREAKSSDLESLVSGNNNCRRDSDWRVRELFRSAIQLAEEGSMCQAVYQAAKSVLRQAFEEVFNAKRGSFNAVRN